MKVPKVLFQSRGLFVGLLLVLFQAGSALAAEPIEIDAHRAKELLDSGDALVIFPLSSIEYNNLHIEGSINLPIEQLPAGLPDDKMKALVFYCLGRT